MKLFDTIICIVVLLIPSHGSSNPTVASDDPTKPRDIIQIETLQLGANSLGHYHCLWMFWICLPSGWRSFPCQGMMKLAMLRFFSKFARDLVTQECEERQWHRVSQSHSFSIAWSSAWKWLLWCCKASPVARSCWAVQLHNTDSGSKISCHF